MAENTFEQEYLSTLPENTIEGLPSTEEVPVENAPVEQVPMDQPEQQFAVPQQDPPRSKYKSYDDALNAVIVQGDRAFPLARS